MSSNRILRWISTGNYTFGADDQIEKGQYASGETSSVFSDHMGEISSNDSACPSTNESPEDTNPPSEPVEMLAGCDNDILIPTTDQINSTFLKGQTLWRAYVASAGLLPFGSIPAVSLEAYNLIRNVPPLPRDLRGKRFISGRALWHVQSPEFHQSRRNSEDDNHGAWNPELVHGVEKNFFLSAERPTLCKISTRPNFYHFADGQQPSRHAPNAVAIFTLMWSYILSARLLEMQRHCIQYSHTTLLSPVLTKDVKPESGDIVVPVGHASKELVRWLCAILVQGAGWVVKARLPPWAAFYDGDARFVISSLEPFMELQDERAPGSAAAADLLIEFCQLYSFGSQPTTAFLAALVLPIHGQQGLVPHLPKPMINGRENKESTCIDHIWNHYNNLPYYMTLSICPRYLGSAIWSIFWEPGIQSNLASAWVGSIHQVIEPFLDAGDLEGLAKIFALRRPRLAPLWLGMFICGCSEVIEMIESYLTTLEMHPFYASAAYPDPDVSVWTGSPQSFFDEPTSGPYIEQDSDVPRADLLRHRFDFRLGDGDDIVHFGWQPFGTIKKTDIELELWPRLECQSQPRRYIHWIWWMSKDMFLIEPGFKHDNSQLTPCSEEHTDCIELRKDTPKVVIPSELCCEVRLEPSKQATFRILDWGSKMASGERSIEAIAMPGIRKHPWLADVREIA